MEFKFPSESQIRKKGRHRGEKWLDYWGWLRAKLAEAAPDVVVVEDVRRHSSTLAGHSYGFFRYAIEALCAEAKVPFVALGVTDWKKKTVGKGRAEKYEVATAVDSIYGPIQFESDDHSDALGIAHAYHKETIDADTRDGRGQPDAGGEGHQAKAAAVCRHRSAEEQAVDAGAATRAGGTDAGDLRAPGRRRKKGQV